jgi:DinB superfamily
MNTATLLKDGFGRVRETALAAVADLSADQLSHRLADGTNSISWLVWHLTRIEDDHVADVAGLGQVWLEQDWVGRFDLPFGSLSTGYGHTAAEVDLVRVDADRLAGYLEDVHAQSLR